MVVGNISNLSSIKIVNSQAKNTEMKVLVSPIEGWEGYVMRVFEVKEDGFTPKHNHPWPQIIYILEGDGEILIDDKINQVTPGSYACIPSMAMHQFRNVGTTTYKFICIVPEEGHKY